MRGLSIVVAFGWALWAPAARADETRSLQVWWPLDVAITLGAGGVWAGTELGKSQLAPDGCRWCAGNGLDGGVRDGLRWQNPKRADSISNMTAFAAAPVVALGSVILAGHGEAGPRRALENGLLVAESLLITGAFNQSVKFVAGRERPFVHALPADQKPLTDHPADNDLSFFSAHTSTGFALASSVATVAHLRRYRSARWLWAPVAALAASSGYLRLAADKHWFTDVMTGALVGTAVGVAVPVLHVRAPQPAARAEAGSMRLVAVPGGLMLAGAF